MKYIAALLLLVAAVQAANLLYSDSPAAISGSYIVVLKEGTAVARRDAHIEKLKATIAATNDASEIGFLYHIGSFVGFSAKLSAEVLKIELADADVDFIEADQTVSIAGTYTQAGSTWGLNRIAVREKLSPSPPYSYTYNTQGGLGVNVYVIDTGILPTHVDFQTSTGSRAVSAFNAITNEQNVDLNGHGTHCAGTIGGSTYGVAKNVSLFGVKVLSASGSGSYSGVVAGVNYATTQFQSTNVPSVASMSLGGPVSAALDTAIKNSLEIGVAYSVAAGNDNSNACNYSPARVSETTAAITVGATAVSDSRASYSNLGKCVTVFAPGSLVTSDWIGSSNTAINTISGTSMATPHVAGVLALRLGQNSALSPADLKAWIISEATTGAVVNPGTGSPNLLLYSPSS